MELFWGEDFTGAGVAGGLKGGHEGFVGMDFVGEAFACTLLTFGDVALARHSKQAFSALTWCNVAVVGEIGNSKVLLVHKHNNEI